MTTRETEVGREILGEEDDETFKVVQSKEKAKGCTTKNESWDKVLSHYTRRGHEE